MKFLLLNLIGFVGFSSAAFPATVTGNVYYGLQPYYGVPVNIQKENGSRSDFVCTGFRGEYSFDVPDGAYILQVWMSYADWGSNGNESAPNIYRPVNVPIIVHGGMEIPTINMQDAKSELWPREMALKLRCPLYE